MSDVYSSSARYLDYAHKINVSNIGRFSLAVCAICLLLFTDTTGPNPDVNYNHIFNSDNVAVIFFVAYLLVWLILKFIKNNIIVQKVAVWCGVSFAYLFANALSYLTLSSNGSITAAAVAYLMVSFLFAERLLSLLILMLCNGLVLYLIAYYLTDIDPVGFRIELISILFLASSVAYTMDKQRREVFNSQQKIAKQVDELNRALDVKSAFFGHMSHELRTPLNAIIGFSEMLTTLTETKLNRKMVKEYAEYINTGGNHLLSLVNDLLDQNKIETGFINVSIEKVDAALLLQNYVDELKPISLDKEQTIDLHLVNECIEFDTDRRLFKQIIYNVLSNAQKYTPNKGSIEIIARQGIESVEIVIKDNGKGMPNDVVEQIGKSDLPIKSHFISQAEGTGLGLIIVQQLMSRLNATLEVRSEEGAGTEFKMLFPNITTP